LDSSKRVKDHEARVISPIFGAAYSECVLEFYYHMYGRNIGLFEIDLFKNGTDDHLYVTSTKMFELKGIVLFILFIFYLKPYRSDYVAD